MAVVQTIINRALRILGVLDANESPQAVDTQTAIEALNAMATRWEADGVSIGWVPVSAGSDTLPAPEEAQAALAYNLAVTLRPEYGRPLAPDVIAMAQEGFARLYADVYSNDYAIMDLELPTSNGVDSQRAFERGF
jgi:P22 tail accessory factor